MLVAATLALLVAPARALQVQPELPGPSFVGSFGQLFRGSINGQSHRVMTDLMETHGDNYIVRFPTPWTRWAFLNSPETIEQLLIEVNPPPPIPPAPPRSPR